MIRFKRDPIELGLAFGREYGDIVWAGAGSFGVYVLYHPGDVRQVLLDNHHNYVKQSVLASFTGENLVTAEGDSWLFRRRLMQPAFHHHSLTRLGELMADDVKALVERWLSAAGNTLQLDIQAEMRHLTLQMVGHTLFGMDLGMDGPLGPASAVIDDYLSYRLFSLAPLPLAWPTPRNRQLRKALVQFREALLVTIHDRRQNSPAGHDLLAMLMEARDENGAGFSDEQLCREVGVLIGAGHETTTSGLTWAFYLLARNVQCEAKLQAELESVLQGRPPTLADLPNLTYTRRVIEETLRLYPPAWALGRRSLATDTIGGYRLPANADILIPTFAIQRDERFWRDPDCFNPERFEEQPGPAASNFAYLPFGGGPRLCIGNTFALTEMQLILAAVAQRFQMQLLPGYKAETRAMITLQIKGGLPMIVRARALQLRHD